MNWLKGLKIKVKERQSLKRYTSFRIGGAARYFARPKDALELKLLINRAKSYNIPVLVMGSGSNILASDSGINALVIRLDAPCFCKISLRNGCLESGCGAGIGRFLAYAQKKGLSGAEFLAGIPASVGGALVGNAGITQDTKAKGRKVISIGDLTQSVTVMDRNGKTRILKKTDLKFGYRKSNLSKFIVLGACFRLKKQNRRVVRQRISEYLVLRKQKLDLSAPSAGCIFKNPPHHSAGRLIDMAGLKGKKVKGACVSDKHANFILNRDNAGSADVLALMGLIRKKVKDKFNIHLEPEIRIWK